MTDCGECGKCPNCSPSMLTQYITVFGYNLMVDCGSGWEPDDGPCYWDNAPGESSCFRHNLERVVESRHGPFTIPDGI